MVTAAEALFKPAPLPCVRLCQISHLDDLYVGLRLFLSRADVKIRGVENRSSHGEPKPSYLGFSTAESAAVIFTYL